MRQEVFQREMEVAEIQGNIRKNRGLNWAIISLALIILTIIIGLTVAVFLSERAPQMLNESSNTAGAPVQSK